MKFNLGLESVLYSLQRNCKQLRGDVFKYWKIPKNSLYSTSGSIHCNLINKFDNTRVHYFDCSSHYLDLLSRALMMGLENITFGLFTNFPTCWRKEMIIITQFEMLYNYILLNLARHDWDIIIIIWAILVIKTCI